MPQHVPPRKLVGAYLKVVKALNELEALDDDTFISEWDLTIHGIAGTIKQGDDGTWRFVQA